MHSPKHTTSEDWKRLQAKIQVDENGCWLWQGFVVKLSGYGSLIRQTDGKRKIWAAHRYLFYVFNGPVEAGLHILHHCDVRHCVNPDHLYAGTHVDNMRDVVVRRRHDHKLTLEQEWAVVRRYEAGESIEVLAKDVGLSNRWTASIISRKLNIPEKDMRPRGSRNHACTISFDEVLEMRRLFEIEGMLITDIGRLFGRGKSTVSRIVNYQSRIHA